MSLLYDLNESTVVEKVTMKWPSDEYVIPAGTPMSRTGIANDKNAIGILANEARIKFHYPLSVAKHIGKEEPKGKQDYTFSLITSGFVNLTEAEASFGAKISEEAKSAMGEINFVNETEPASFGGGGGSNILETVGGDTLTWDGVTDGLYCVDAGGGIYYHVSNETPNITDFSNGCILDGIEYGVEVVEDIGNGVLMTPFGLVVPTDNNSDAGVLIEKKGVYFIQGDFGDGLVTYSSLTINGYTGFTKQQIKEEYIPDSLKGGGGDSLFAKLGYDMEYVHFGDKSFPIHEDFMSGNTIVSDADFASIEAIISEKIIYTYVYGEGMVICRFSVNNGYISVTMGSDTMHLYSESASQ